MNSNTIYDIIIIGGGLAGLSTALHLGNKDISILLIEKNDYPHHKVCGEYISNEVLPYLNSLGIYPVEKGAIPISRFEITNYNGRMIKAELPLGGFGMSRYFLDNLMFEKLNDSVDVVIDTVVSIGTKQGVHNVQTKSKQSFMGRLVIGAYGKRSNLDKSLGRKFIDYKSPWLAVKGHYKADHPRDTVSLHHFDGGYCGLSQTENGSVNVCYLTTYQSFKRSKDIDDFQKKTLEANPYLKRFFDHSELLFEQPLTISQISFERKSPVKDGIIMIGDSAGLIHPLCGNGMAMAIHSAKIFSELYLEWVDKQSQDIDELIAGYSGQWEMEFATRLKAGRIIQKLLLQKWSSNIGFAVGEQFPSLVRSIIKQTHGKPF
ncbi:MAG: FAD-dependent oxidoreductase [Flavobacteriaceae bacterium]|nr:FAD-dependent oxidoreductase [Flavobacteriaceae bacterium]